MQEVSVIKLSQFNQIGNPEEASLIAYQSNQIVPFSINRIFNVTACQKCKRGFHAHKECSQFLVVLQGSCKVVCDDGSNKVSFILNKPSEGILVPPSIWAEQEYEKNTILMVLTDRPYDENDYIRDYQEFLKYRTKI